MRYEQREKHGSLCPAGKVLNTYFLTQSKYLEKTEKGYKRGCAKQLEGID